MSKKLNLAVIFGGRSGEHEVSLVSATAVIKNLDKRKYNIIQVGITKGGEWIVGPDALRFLKNGKGKRLKREAISPDTIKNKIGAKKIDVVFPVLHGTYGEDGTIQGLFEMADIAYVGAGVLGSAVAMDKIMQKIVCGAENILVPDWVWLSKKEWQWTKKSKPVFKKWLDGLEQRLGYPIFIKPSNLGSSVGITKVHNRDELVKAINLAAKYDRRILIEKGIEKAMEVDVGVLGNQKPEVSVPCQIVPANEYYDYEAKYVDEKTELKIPAPIPKAVTRKIQEISIEVFKLLDCAGMGRAEFLIQRKGKNWIIYFGEMNTIPGFTSHSIYPRLWQAKGVSYKKLLDILIRLALERYKEKCHLSRTHKTTDWYK